MLGFVKDKFLYIKVPKNGCMTYTNILNKNGWQEINLFENDLDLAEMIIWGHLTDPEERHTRGIDTYLRINPGIDYRNPTISKMLVSAVFDEHTYSVSMMMSGLLKLPINWIPLDAVIHNYQTNEELTGDDLTNIFFAENNIDINVKNYPRHNVSSNNLSKLVRQQINDYKKLYVSNYQKLVKNFLEPDILLYNSVLDKYRKKYA